MLWWQLWKLRPRSEKVRNAAADALVRIGPAAVTHLVAAFDRNAEVQRTPANALIRIGPAAVADLVAALKNRDQGSYVRPWAAYTLGEIGDVRAVDPLVAVLKDRDSNVRKEAR
jgi:HEAT repeat protein